LFKDLTPDIVNGHIESWQWNFNDGGSAGQQNPSHTFQTAGNYNVEFAVTTDRGCTNSIVKQVSILQSPVLNFTNSPSCLNKSTSLNATTNSGQQFYWEVGTAFYQTQSINHTFASTGSHPVKVTTVGPNQCATTLIKNILIPDPVTPAFNFTNNCKGSQTNFTSVSTSVDPILAHLWNFAGEGTSVEANPMFTFANTGNKSVSLQITTQSGCVYQSQKNVNVIDPPVAKFSFTPGFGVPPQEIAFANESTNATLFNWNFGDGNQSVIQSPSHTFTALGDYAVELKASNSAGCESTASNVVSMVAPLPDVDLNLMTITPNADGTLKVIITIANKGNTILRNLPVQLDLSGQVTLETIVPEPIVPFSQYNLVLNYSITQRPDLEFLCASTKLDGDLHPEGNRVCNQLKTELAIIAPYPNPVSEYLAVEWVAAGSEEVQIQLLDSQGKSAITHTETSLAGLNQKYVDVRSMRAGIYILRILSANRAQSHRILVSH
jgi:PKD repeat protein